MTHARSRTTTYFILSTLLGLCTSFAASNILLVDQDLRPSSPFHAGAILKLDLRRSPLTSPLIELATDQAGVPLEYLTAIDVNPLDGKIWVSDRRGEENAAGRLRAMECGTRSDELAAEDELLPEPSGLAFLPDGRLAIVDADADPSSLGTGGLGGLGPGAVFWKDVLNGEISLLSDGLQHGDLPGVAPDETVFKEPRAIAASMDGTTFYVVDSAADPLATGRSGAVFSVDASTGRVELVSAHEDFVNLRGVAAHPDGRILVVDALPHDSILWLVDPDDPDPSANAQPLSGGPQFALLEAVAVDSSGRVFVTDLGQWDAAVGAFLVRPAVYEVDLLAPLLTNAVLINHSDGLVTPVGLVANRVCPDSETAGLSIHEMDWLDWNAAVDPGCLQPGLRLCSTRTAPGDLVSPITLEDEVEGAFSNWFTIYEHDSDPWIHVAKDGANLVISHR